jgi:predicted alpha/beta-fold hydrolase
VVTCSCNTCGTGVLGGGGITRVHVVDKMFQFLARSSNAQGLVEQVVAPLLCINALDDPLVPEIGIPFDEVALSPNVVLAMTSLGGHVAHFEGWIPRCWWISPVMQFLSAALESNVAADGLNAVMDLGAKNT